MQLVLMLPWSWRVLIGLTLLERRKGTILLRSKILKAHSPGEDVCCLSFNDVLLVSGSSSGSLKLFNLETSELVGNLSMGSVAYNSIKIKGGMVIAAAGQKVTVQVCKNLEEKLEVGLRLQFLYRSLDLFNLFATRY